MFEEQTKRLARLRTRIFILEQELRDLKAERDLLIVEALQAGMAERKICLEAGVTRGWIWKLKLREAKRYEG